MTTTIATQPRPGDFRGYGSMTGFESMFAVALFVTLLAMPALAQQASGPLDVFTPAEGRTTIRPDWRTINANPLGDYYNPVRVHGPFGRRAYLSRLVCPEGGVPVFTQAGQHGRGPYGSPLEIFVVSCANLARRVHIDVFHVPEYIGRRAIDGFTIRDP